MAAATVDPEKMDSDFTEKLAKRRQKVDELFDFEGMKIGRGTYGHVYRAKRRSGSEIHVLT